MVPFNQGSQSALQTSTTLPLLLLLLILLLLIYFFFHFTGEEPEAQKEKSDLLQVIQLKKNQG